MIQSDFAPSGHFVTGAVRGFTGGFLDSNFSEIYTSRRGGSRGVRRVLEHPSNIHTFTAKNGNCSEAVLKIIKLLLLIMTTALKLC